MWRNDESPDQHARVLIKRFKTAMLTTVGDDGRLRSRPMVLQQVEFDGNLWFFAADDSEKVREIAREPQVGVTLASDRETFVALSGRAHVTRDRIRIRELWNPACKPWFPGGPDDPRLVVVKVVVEGGEYWDASSGRTMPFTGKIMAVLAGESPADDLAEHARFRT